MHMDEQLLLLFEGAMGFHYLKRYFLLSISFTIFYNLIEI